jgi:hypothetical protein
MTTGRRAVEPARGAVQSGEMIKFKCVLFLIGLGWLTAFAPAAQVAFKEASAQGELFVVSLTNAPFPHPSRAGGHEYQGRNYPASTHYSDSSVAFFIPKGFRPSAHIDFVVHFHGWNNAIAQADRDFGLVEQFAASRRNAVLILPEGPFNAPDSSGGKLEDALGFERFMAETMSVLRGRPGFSNAVPGKIVLSGHSGAYRVISAILDVGGMAGSVREVYLFDALYGQAPRFHHWIDHEKAGRLVVIYTDHGGTLDESTRFIQAMSARGLKHHAGEEADVTDPQLRSNRLLFLHSTGSHNEVLARGGNLRSFLETSCLDSIVE